MVCGRPPNRAVKASPPGGLRPALTALLFSSGPSTNLIQLHRRPSMESTKHSSTRPGVGPLQIGAVGPNGLDISRIISVRRSRSVEVKIYEQDEQDEH